MSRDQNLSSLRLAILCLILQAPRSGYRLKKVFEETPMGHFSASPGAIYPALKRMEEDGWISGTVDNPTSLRPTRTLSLTEKGRAFLRTHFLLPVVEQDVVFRMDQLMLRFAFMSPLVGREATCAFLEQFIDVLASHVSSLHAVSRTFENDPLEGVLALQQGIESYECKLKWARNALSVLARKIPAHRRS
jgi:DNA-binding PadR family transcriptional regulator